ncbi:MULTISPECIES: DUF1697 domain-containing protein [unclassified Lentimicrobium]|uniref:DUF1697 domain-containing protein n=1 Tax=unclassified Lentimicrobium TaxID=2677434 RepID=UPI001551DFE7|nr:MULTISPECIES: DUF1697 domain-containing protein [unclassified Lentimicrobium]NPD46146.1 DUF1697 domain-containing protein [Lentimicrobium sp. S6]NPD86296.1 DUF1697 domain-containing protein [Lentimicrobium sp. L6]
MTTYISILRGINVGGHRKIIMAELRKMYEQLGFSQVKSYIQSGNVVYESNQKMSSTELEKLLENSIKETFGHEVPVLIRTSEEWEMAIKANPFLNEESNTDKLFITFLSESPSPELKEELSSMDFSPDQLKIIDKCVYLYCERKYHETKMTHSLIERKLKVKATARNWKTIMKLKELSH